MRDTLIVQSLYIRFSRIVLEQAAKANWLFIIKNLVVQFIHTAVSLDFSIIHFQSYFYKHIRELQLIIPILGAKIINFTNLKFLQKVSALNFINDLKLIRLFDPSEPKSTFYTQLKPLLINNENALKIIMKIRFNFGVRADFLCKDISRFNLYLFLFYLKLYELEEILQWLNWVAFRISLQGIPYKFHRSSLLHNFLLSINKFGYQSWHEKQFQKPKNSIFKLKKKWRF
jgi:hypothetical protein